MHLTIGALLGMRSQIGMGRAMHASRVIGFSPSHTLFVTPPMVGGQPLLPMPGENVEIVAVTTQAVFWFVCTVEAICTHPFDYLVLSAPGNIRQLRERKAVRVRTHLAVRHGIDLTGLTLDGMGVGCDLSVFGMSLATTAPIGCIGERVRVALQLTTRNVDSAPLSVVGESNGRGRRHPCSGHRPSRRHRLPSHHRRPSRHHSSRERHPTRRCHRCRRLSWREHRSRYPVR